MDSGDMFISYNRKLREEAKISFRDFDKLCGVNIRQWEYRGVKPGMAAAEKVANFWGMSLGNFIKSAESEFGGVVNV